MKTQIVIVLTTLVAAIALASIFMRGSHELSPTTTTTSVRFISSTITADGVVTAQSQAKLSFQTSGKLAYLKIKEGDRVKAGQILAALDLGDLETAWNRAHYTYEAADAYAKQIEDAVKGHDSDETFAQKTQRVAAQTTRDAAYDAMLAAQRAIDNAQLKAPFNGIVTHEDVSVPGINITPATTFTVADPDSMVFRANIPAENIYYVSVGSAVTLAIDGVQDKIAGTVVKIFPSKVVLVNGQAVYQVDIDSDVLKKDAKLDQAGKAIISTNSENVALVPAWTVLGGKYIWVDNNGTPELKQIIAGKTHGNEIEVTGGLSVTDKIIVNPQFISTLKYQIL
jgi:RND family efflux transporter MFP subunit